MTPLNVALVGYLGLLVINLIALVIARVYDEKRDKKRRAEVHAAMTEAMIKFIELGSLATNSCPGDLGQARKKAELYFWETRDARNLLCCHPRGRAALEKRLAVFEQQEGR